MFKSFLRILCALLLTFMVGTFSTGCTGPDPCEGPDCNNTDDTGDVTPDKFEVYLLVENPLGLPMDVIKNDIVVHEDDTSCEILITSPGRYEICMEGNDQEWLCKFVQVTKESSTPAAHQTCQIDDEFHNCGDMNVTHSGTRYEVDITDLWSDYGDGGLAPEGWYEDSRDGDELEVHVNKGDSNVVINLDFGPSADILGDEFYYKSDAEELEGTISDDLKTITYVYDNGTKVFEGTLTWLSD